MIVRRGRRRTGEARRETKEVEIHVWVDLDGKGMFEGDLDPPSWTTCSRHYRSTAR